VVALPAIVFGERVGHAELIGHGAAARATIVAMMATQRRSLLDFYVPWRDRREG
jgi:hypothetical protein